MPVKHAARPKRCPMCGNMAPRDIVRDHASTAHEPGNWPMVSEAVGVHPLDAKAAEEYAAKIGVPTRFTKDGNAIFTSARHRKEYCERHGFYDRNGGYGDPQRK